VADNYPEIATATRAEWERLQRADAAGASKFYFQHILPTVVMHHRQHSPRPIPCDLLVSLLGFSPETTVLATTFMRPQQLVIVTSINTERYCRQCMDFLTEHALIGRERIGVRVIDATDHDALYMALCDALVGASGSCMVDLTGGKKIMSAVAGYAAWSLGLPICYVEGRAYNEQMRRPEPGSEEIVILNPPARPHA
jgi:hypothetical protein